MGASARLDREAGIQRDEAGTAVADEQVDKLIESLEATFDASVARAEDEAASDLALSLLQDATFVEALRHSGPLEARIDGRVPAPVTEVGDNYLACGSGGSLIVPLGRAVVATTAPGSGPVARETTLLSVLRGHVRRGSIVEVTAHGVAYRGRLAQACIDHLVIVLAGAAQRGPRELLIGVQAIEAISVPPGGDGAVG
jgi:hypothetical protein